jgi:hypothetical protein
VELAIEVGSDPISGSIVVGAGEPRRFRGWIELVAELEAARRGNRGAASTETLGWLPGAISESA